MALGIVVSVHHAQNLEKEVGLRQVVETAG